MHHLLENENNIIQYLLHGLYMCSPKTQTNMALCKLKVEGPGGRMRRRKKGTLLSQYSHVYWPLAS